MTPFDRQVPLALTAQLINFESRGFEAGTALAQAQGSTALYNILCRERLAYLADEVGMGKTYQAFGVLSLLWHRAPNASVIVVAPSETVQDKWLADYQSFIETNLRVSDDRIRDALTGGAIHPARKANNLVDLAHLAMAEPHALLVTRISSFSSFALTLGLTGESSTTTADVVRALHARRLFVSTEREDANLEGSVEIAMTAAAMLAELLPRFDLVVVDESQKLRNRGGNIRTNVFATLLGLRLPGIAHCEVEAHDYAPRVLMLSATPAHRAESDIYNQLAFSRRDAEAPPTEVSERDAYLRRFFVRRLRLFHGKNKYDYRRPLAEARKLGTEHAVEELFLALVQKRLERELDAKKRLGTAMKIGFLETFESYKPSVELLEPAHSDDPDDKTRDFDDESDVAPDTGPLVELVSEYRAALGEERLPPHPKQVMIEELAEASFISPAPQKTLIFVRRLASVRELARRISSAYDRAALQRVSELLGESFGGRDQFLRHVESILSKDDGLEDEADSDDAAEGGEGRSRMLDIFTSRKNSDQRSHTFRMRFNADRPLASVFEENLVRFWFEWSGLRAEFGSFKAFAEAELNEALREAAATVELTPEYFRKTTFLRSRARWLVQQRALAAARTFAKGRGLTDSATAAGELEAICSFMGGETKRQSSGSPSATNLERCRDLLHERSFWDHLRIAPQESSIAAFLAHDWHRGNLVHDLRRREAIRNVVDKNLRVGEGIFAIFAAYASAEALDQDARFVDAGVVARELCAIFNGDSIDGQRLRSRTSRYLPVADQLSKYLYGGGRGRSLPVYADTKLSEFNDRSPINMVTGGSGSRRQTIVQFNSPFLPDFVVSTNVLQEGVDLHLSCDNVWHYGLASTPGAIEQRVGRIDRYYSMAHRALAPGAPGDAERTLQVVFPYLARSVDEQQLARTLSRIRAVQPLMDRGLQASSSDVFDLDDSLSVTVDSILADIQGIGDDAPAAPFEPERHYEDRGEFTGPVNPIGDAEEHLNAIRRSLRRVFERLSPPGVARCGFRDERTTGGVWLVWANVPLIVIHGRSELARDHALHLGPARDQPVAVQLVHVPALGHRVLRFETPLGAFRHAQLAAVQRMLDERGAARRGVRLRVESGNTTQWGFTLVQDFPHTDSPQLTNTLARFARLADDVERELFEADIRYEHDPRR